MKKKGFTLIELLAVIVIIAIIALIATPTILGVIEKSRKGSAESSALGYIDAIEKQIAIDMLTDEKIIDLTDNTITVGTDDSGLIIKGTKPNSGSTLVVNQETGIIESGTLYITLGGKTYEVEYNGATGKATVKGSSSSDDETKEETLTGPTKELPTSGETYKAIVYLDPTDLTKYCNASNSVSTTGTISGCMKWYVFDDSGDNYTMILDHNTSGSVSWNSSGNNADGMNEVKTRLEEDTTGWQGSPRLIIADEVAEITGANLDTTIKWSSTKIYGTDDIEINSSDFYLDGTGTTYSSTDGWMKKVATTKGSSKYAWLYDNTSGCTAFGCNLEDNNLYSYGTKDSINTAVIFGYWTNTPMNGISYGAWSVRRNGIFCGSDIVYAGDFGVRPVITISKSIIS